MLKFLGVLSLLVTSNLGLSSDWTQNPSKHSIHQKYAEKGAKPATGRSGTATLKVRALVNKDSTTSLEVTTGELDQMNSQSNLMSKVQVKKMSSDNTVIQTMNYSNNSNTFSLTMPEVTRGQSLQVQANVRGQDGKRTDVVTVKANAILRPDTAVTKLQMPETTTPNSSVVILAEVKELNGDVGATANCVLTVDGTETASIPALWIDAGSTVNCMFTHSFSQSGPHTVKVSVTHQVPADYSSDNNSQEATIMVQSSMNLNYSASAYKQYTKYSNSYYYYYGYNYISDNYNEGIYLNVSADKEISFPVNITVTNSIDGALVNNDSVTLAPTDTYNYDWTYGYQRQSCGYSYSTDGYRGIQFCSGSYNYDVNYYTTQEWSSLYSWTYSGVVTYSCDGYSNCYYYQNYSYGVMHSDMNVVDLSATVVGQNGLGFALDTQVQVNNPYEYNYGWNSDLTSCYQDYYYYSYCYYYKGKSGQSFGTVP